GHVEAEPGMRVVLRAACAALYLRHRGNSGVVAYTCVSYGLNLSVKVPSLTASLRFSNNTWISAVRAVVGKRKLATRSLESALTDRRYSSPPACLVMLSMPVVPLGASSTSSIRSVAFAFGRTNIRLARLSSLKKGRWRSQKRRLSSRHCSNAGLLTAGSFASEYRAAAEFGLVQWNCP